MRNVQPLRERALYLCAQNVLKNSAKPVEPPLPHQMQIEIGNETIPYVWIDWMNGRSFHN